MNNLKKLVLGSTLILISTGVPLSAFAEMATTTLRKQINQQIKEKRETVNTQIKEKREEANAAVKAKFEEAQKLKKAVAEKATEMRKTMQAEIKAKRTIFKNETEERVNALKKKLGDVRAKKIEEYFKRMVKKFEAAIDRLNDLSDRIEKHLNKLADNGKDTAGLKDKLAKARAKIGEAETALENMKTKYGEMASSTDPVKKFKDVKKLGEMVTPKLKDAHRSLVDVINSIKGMSGTSATSTNATSTSSN